MGMARQGGAQGRVEPKGAHPFAGGRTLYHLKKACLVERIGQLPHRATAASSSCLCCLVPSPCTESDGKERFTTRYVEWLQDVQLIVPHRKSARVRQRGGAVGRTVVVRNARRG